MSFEILGLSEELLRAVGDSGYTEPTPIQRQAIPTVLQGRDVLGVAQTGTGKTASFTLPMIDVLAQGRTRARMPRSLILEPTRELAVQVAENFEKYGKYHKLNMALLIGGMSFGDQDKVLSKGADVLIATPGRLIDQIERGKVMLSGCEILVIDEADRMLDMGFIPDIEKICNLLPPRRQTLLFSATMPPAIKRLADQFLKDPKFIEVARPATTNVSIAQSMMVVPERSKREVLRSLLRSEEVNNAIIFCNRKRDVRTLHESLTRHGFKAGQLHGDMDQPERLTVLEKFRSGEVPILVASDVAARGLDIPGVSHVFNFDVPIHADDYVHRIGRTGRAGRTGTAITLATEYEAEMISAVEKLIQQPIPRRDPPEDVRLGERDAAPAKRRGARKDAAPKSEGGTRGRRSKSEAGKAEAKGEVSKTETAKSETGKTAAPRDEAKAKPASPAPAPAPIEARASERPERSERYERNDRYDRQERGERGRGRDRRDDRYSRYQDRDEPVLGFGDNPPAFFLVTTRKPDAETADTKTEKAEQDS
ncbi:MAG TPA: DEAD/DEAH box helicase [Pedomonas sp.]|uniref:DEAD/DEAH box helicase n=1 Tax=Pedomonas sp. TaxID=2976421 RepID=UPI002F41973A